MGEMEAEEQSSAENPLLVFGRVLTDMNIFHWSQLKAKRRGDGSADAAAKENNKKKQSVNRSRTISFF